MTAAPKIDADPARSSPPAGAVRRRAVVAYVWLFLGYIAYYLCRQNFSVAFGPMQTAGLLTKHSYGWIVTAGTLCYALGKIVTGTWADRFGGKRIFLIGMVGSAAVTAPMGLAPMAVAVGLFWCSNRFFQSMGWGGLVNVAVRWSDPTRYGTDMGFLSMSYLVGGGVAAAFAGALLTAGLGWRALFFVPALVLCVFALVVRRQLEEAPASVVAASPSGAPREARGSLLALLSRPAFLVACGLSFGLTLVRECFNNWLPAYFSGLGAADDAAAFKSTVFPLLGALGTLALGWTSDRVPQLPRGRTMAVALAVAALGLLGLAELPWVAARTGIAAASAATVLVGIVGFFLLGAYAIVAGGALALDFGGRHASATAAGALDAIGYLGASLAGIGVASLVEHQGWNVTFGLLAAGCAACVGLSLTVDFMRRSS